MPGIRMRFARLRLFLLVPVIVLVPAMLRADVIYVADGGDNTLAKIDQFGVVTTFATGFNNPQGVAIDSTGNIFVADGGTNSIKKVTALGVVTTFANLANSPVG